MLNEEIIQGIKEQNKTIEQQFYLSNKDKCVQYAMKQFFLNKADGISLKCSLEDAEELYNDACVLFIQNVLRERIVSLDARITTYLITSMRYTWMNKARAKKTDVQAQAEEVPQISKENLRVNVRKAINQLDIKCREMMTYRYILGWEDYNDIAKVTGKNNGDVVRNLISRCRKRFREIYSQGTKLSGIN